MDIKPKCPKCESSETVPVRYVIGYAPNTLYGSFCDEKEEFLGMGCCVLDDSPKWFCKGCRYAFQNAGDQNGSYLNITRDEMSYWRSGHKDPEKN